MQLPVNLYKRKADTHKGSYGYVLIVGGSPGLTGAVCLAARAALKAGAGLVKAAVPQSLNPVFEAKLTEVMSLALDDEGGHLCLKGFDKLCAGLSKVDVLAVGPGAGMLPATQELILKIIKEADKPLVVDADGLNALALHLEELEERKNNRLLLTPHPGEFSRLIQKNTGQIADKRKELAQKFALRYNLSLVLKGNRTIVTDGKGLFENQTGNPGMATAGAGDVLTGVIAGLLAQGLQVFEAAKIGVYLHGLAGDLAAEDKTQMGLVASDLIDYLPEAIKRSI